MFKILKKKKTKKWFYLIENKPNRGYILTTNQFGLKNMQMHINPINPNTLYYKINAHTNEARINASARQLLSHPSGEALISLYQGN